LMPVSEEYALRGRDHRLPLQRQNYLRSMARSNASGFYQKLMD